jgi:hypothetical protein
MLSYSNTAWKLLTLLLTGQAKELSACESHTGQQPHKINIF